MLIVTASVELFFPVGIEPSSNNKAAGRRMEGPFVHSPPLTSPRHCNCRDILLSAFVTFEPVISWPLASCYVIILSPLHSNGTVTPLTLLKLVDDGLNGKSLAKTASDR